MNLREIDDRLGTFTPQRLREMADVMLAAANGCKIQNRRIGGTYWLTAPPCFDWAQYDYRVEPLVDVRNVTQFHCSCGKIYREVLDD